MRRSQYERVVEMRGFKYIKLKSGRFVTFWNMIDAAESAHTDLARAISRAFKLVDNDYDLERLQWFVEEAHTYLHHLEKEIEKRRGVKTQQERIALLRNTTGRTPEEAEAYRRKADQLEAEMQSKAS
jgi:hypothetical protein